MEIIFKLVLIVYAWLVYPLARGDLLSQDPETVRVWLGLVPGVRL